MSEKTTELSRALVVGQKSDGRKRYDPEAKRELIVACLKPGVSVAAMALRYGLNANLLRTWISRYQREQNVGAGHRGSARDLPAVASAFVQVVPPKHAAAVKQVGVVARLPNGINIELGDSGAAELATILRLLWQLPCSSSTRG